MTQLLSFPPSPPHLGAFKQLSLTGFVHFEVYLAILSSFSSPDRLQTFKFTSHLFDRGHHVLHQPHACRFPSQENSVLWLLAKPQITRAPCCTDHGSNKAAGPHLSGFLAQNSTKWLHSLWSWRMNRSIWVEYFVYAPALTSSFVQAEMHQNFMAKPF